MTHNMKKFAGKALLSGGVALVGLGLASGTAQAFNPQPDPPGRQATGAVNQPPEVQSKPGIIVVNPQSRVHIGVQGGGA
jgi:hypothetical protein